LEFTYFTVNRGVYVVVSTVSKNHVSTINKLQLTSGGTLSSRACVRVERLNGVGGNNVTNTSGEGSSDGCGSRENRLGTKRTVKQFHTVEVGGFGQTVDLRGQALEFLVKEATLCRGQRTGVRLSSNR